MTRTVLHIDASARGQASASRDLSSRIVQRLAPGRILRRDLAEALPQITEPWIGASFTPAPDRDAAQREVLTLSDELVDELIAADTVVIGLPVYNFSIPASLKAWIDLVCRPGRSFEYTENGPRGLLAGKRVVLALASGGTPVGSEADFATGYLRHILKFIGIEDVEIVAAASTATDQQAAVQAADRQIRALAA